jgi:thiol-disulfide isomerase/thioredoxin
MKIRKLILFATLFQIACTFNSKANPKGQPAYIIVEFNGIKEPDSLSLYFLKNTVNDVEIHNYLPAKIITSYRNGSSLFIFKITDIQRPGYFSLNKGDFNVFNNIPLFFLENYIIEPNDSVLINITKARDITRYDEALGLRMYLRRYKKMSFSFSGRGSAKDRCRYDCDSMLMSHQGMQLVEPLSGDTSNYFNLVFPKGLQIIKKYKDSIDKLTYEILKADFVGLLNSIRYEFLYPSLINIPKNNKDQISKNIHFLEKDFATTTASIKSEEAKAISYYYPVSILYLNYDLFTLKGYTTFNIHGKRAFSRLAERYSGELRDKLLTYFIINYYPRIPEKQSLLTKALEIVLTPYCRKLLISFKNAHSVGSSVSNIPLMDKNDNLVRLTQFKGRVIFLDFWFTGCTFCKRYYQNSLSKVEEAFVDNPDVVFVSINADKQKSMWLNSIKKNLYSTDSLPNVINLYTGGKGGEHPIIDFYKISGYPTLMLFDKDGRLFNLSTKDLRVDSAGVTRQINLALKR